MSAPKISSQVFSLLRKEIRLEWRLRFAINGVLLYLLAMLAMIYFTFEEVDDESWILLFWIAMLFTAANAIAKSFTLEGENRNLYYYTLAHPQAIILSKLIYNFGLMLLLGFLGLGMYSFLLGYPMEDSGTFLLALIFGGGAFALVFSMVSAIASKTANAGTLMTILGFPILLPVIRMLSGVSGRAMVGADSLESVQTIVAIVGIDLLVAGLALVLFPYLWRD